MGQITLDVWGGGAISLAPTGATTLRWWPGRRVQTIRASAGLTMQISDADEYPQLPWGPAVLIIINPKDATNSFILRDVPGTFSFTVQIGRAVWVSRIRNGSGVPVWWPWLRTIK